MPKFEDLPMPIQKRLTVFAIGAIQRTKVDLAKRLSKSPIAFGHMAEAAFQANATLEHVITTRFSDAGELENTASQVQIDAGRLAKRKAYNSID